MKNTLTILTINVNIAHATNEEKKVVFFDTNSELFYRIGGADYNLLDQLLWRLF
jgi:hypothetical protein